MADDLELKLRSIKGENPSPDFVASLRKQLAAEIATPVIATDDDPIVTIDLRPHEREQTMASSMKRWLLVGVAAAIAVVVGFFVLATSDDESGLETITPPEESTVLVATTSPATTSAPASGVFGTEVEPLPAGFKGIPIGSHLADRFDSPFAFTIEQSLYVQENLRTRISLSSPSSRDPGDKEILLMPLSVDYQRWLEILDDGLVTLASEEVTFGSLNAVRTDLGESSCSADPFCKGSGLTEAGLSKLGVSGTTYQVWVVNRGDEPPLAVVAGIWRESDIVWFDVVEQIVSTLDFG